MRMMKASAWAILILAATAMAGCSSSSKAKDKCPAGVAVNQQIPCTCGDAQAGARTCQMDMSLSDCVCGTGGGAGNGAGGPQLGSDGGAGTGSNSTGTAGKAGSTAGAGGEESDGGTATAGTGGKSGGTAGSGGGGTGGSSAPTKPPADGSQLASCAMTSDCTDSRVCYTASGQASVGYCTGSCTTDADCTALGKEYSCAAGVGIGAVGQCRITCTGTSDTSCPMFMSCISIPATLGGTPSYRCLYDQKDIGTGTAALWAACDVDGDCTGDLVCYGIGTINGHKGFCTQACMNMNDVQCTTNPTTGTVKTTCNSRGECELVCGVGKTCPTGMDCVSWGPAGSTCALPAM